MENSLGVLSNIMATPVAFMILFIALFWIPRLKRKKKTPPQAGGAWPIIGHLHLLGGPQPPHIVLGNMANKYGPIFTIKMGIHQTLVVNNWEIAKECFTANDLAFANRPNFLAADLLAYKGSMIGFSRYGNLWRQMRKISTLELLSNHRLEMFRHVRESEIGKASKELYKLWKMKKGNCNNSGDKVLVDMKRWFGDVTINFILRIIVGKSVGYETTDEGRQSDEEWKQGLRDFFYLLGVVVVADVLPFLKWLDIGGYEKAMKKTAKKLDVVVKEWLKEHKDEKKAFGRVKKDEEDFMDLLLDVIDDEAEATLNRDSDTINKATCLDSFSKKINFNF